MSSDSALASSKDTAQTPGIHRVISGTSGKGLKAITSDFALGWRRAPLWRTFASDEIQNRYRRSFLGVAWIAVSYLIFVVGISVLFGSFTSKEAFGFVQYVAIGYSAYALLVGNLTDGCSVFRSSSNWILSTDLPYSIYIYRSIARSLFPFSLQMGVAVVVMLGTGWRPNLTIMATLPALGIFILCALWIQTLLGLVSLRWPDLVHLVESIKRILFFATPIMWVYEERGGIAKIVASVNPFTHLIEIFRAPILGEPAALESWLISICFALIGLVASAAAASRMWCRVPFWV